MLYRFLPAALRPALSRAYAAPAFVPPFLSRETFAGLSVPAPLVARMAALGVHRASYVQAQALPPLRSTSLFCACSGPAAKTFWVRVCGAR